MLSLQALNAILNIGLWLSNSFLLKLLELIYENASKLEFMLTGRTQALNTGEVSIFFVFSFLFSRCSSDRSQKLRHITSIWVGALIILAIFFFPSEIWAETGIDERRDCSPRPFMHEGVCDEPWGGHSNVGVASCALLVQKFNWVDTEWDIVYVGSNHKFIAADVHVSKTAKRVKFEGQLRFVARRCSVHISKRDEWGFLTLGKDGGAFDTVVTNYSSKEATEICTVRGNRNFLEAI